LHYQQDLLPEEYNGANIVARMQKNEENLGMVSNESLSTSLINHHLLEQTKQKID
jgi:hypothetical protein